EAAVDEAVLSVACATRRCGQTHQTAQSQPGAVRIDRDCRGAELVAEHGADALIALLRLEVPLRAAVVLQSECDIGPRQRDALENLVAMRVFGRLRFEKFAARRGV